MSLYKQMVFSVPITTGFEVNLDGGGCSELHVKASNEEEQEAFSVWHQLIWGDMHHSNILCVVAVQ